MAMISVPGHCQVHQGVLAYADAFLTEGEVGRQPVKEVLLLKEAYRFVCRSQFFV